MTDQHKIICPKCKGTGKIMIERHKDPENERLKLSEYRTCYICQGTGVTYKTEESK